MCGRMEGKVSTITMSTAVVIVHKNCINAYSTTRQLFYAARNYQISLNLIGPCGNNSSIPIMPDTKLILVY